MVDHFPFPRSSGLIKSMARANGNNTHWKKGGSMSRFLKVFRILNYGFIIISAFPTFGLSQDSNGPLQSLSLSTLVSKQTIKIGEPIYIACLISNKGKESITIQAGAFAYPTAFIEVLDQHQNEMKSFHIVFSDPSLGPDTFVELGPDGNVVLDSRAIVKKGRRAIIARNKSSPKEIEGIYLDFRSSAILLDAGDRYLVRCRFSQIEEEREHTKEQFGIENMWVGNIISDPVQLKIEQK